MQIAWVAIWKGLPGFALHLLICGKCRLFIAHMRSASQVYRVLSGGELDSSTADTLAAGIIVQAAEQNSAGC